VGDEILLLTEIKIRVVRIVVKDKVWNSAEEQALFISINSSGAQNTLNIRGTGTWINIIKRLC